MFNFNLFTYASANNLKIAVMYLTVLAGAGTVLVFCTFWVYHYVELDFDGVSSEWQHNGQSRQIDIPAMGDILLPFAEDSRPTDTHDP
jgi:hypothetical protein